MKEEVWMIEKTRPNAEVRLNQGVDGRDTYYHIVYSCPRCGRIIRGYRSDVACDVCATFYDWGDREPKIKVSRTVEW